jgi:hypothetical protein
MIVTEAGADDRVTQLLYVEFAAGHHPFLSRPVAFAESIVAAIERG